MSDKPIKTPGQVAELRKVFYAAFNRHPVDEWESEDAATDSGIAAVLAHAAPKWHPVSEPVPRHGNYWTRTVHGNTILWGRIDANFKFNPDAYTHWCGPIEPPPFPTKEGV